MGYIAHFRVMKPDQWPFEIHERKPNKYPATRVYTKEVLIKDTFFDKHARMA